MKKHLLKALTFISVTAMLLSGCGNEQSSDNISDIPDIATEAPEATPVPTEVPTVIPEVTEAPTSKPTEAPAPEATEAPSPEPTEAPLPEDRAWIDDIYNMFVKNDIDGLQKMLIDPELAERAAPYEYVGWSYFENEKAYRLVTTDGKVIGLILYEENGYFSNSVFYCEDESRDYGFITIETGDKIFHTYKSTANGEIIYEWYDGKLEYYSDGTVVDPETYGGYLLVWQM